MLCTLVEHYYKYNLFFFNMEDNIIYYPQLLLEQCSYKRLISNPIFHPDLEFTDTEPDSGSEEEEINENTVV